VLAAASRQWWVVVLEGILGIVFGILALIYPGITLITLAILFAVWAIVAGLFEIIQGFRVAEHRGRSWPFAVMGVLAIAAGVIAFVVPGITLIGLAILLGAWLLVKGVLEVYTAWRIRNEVSGEWLLALAGVLAIVAGVIILAMPAIGIVLAIALIASWAIVGGVLAIFFGLRLRSLGQRMGTVGTPGPTGAAAA
jgi:uncharacterized membrane protein HdeD (DUF308 family)